MFRVSTLGIVIIVRGRYLIFGYLDPSSDRDRFNAATTPPESITTEQPTHGPAAMELAPAAIACKMYSSTTATLQCPQEKDKLTMLWKLRLCFQSRCWHKSSCAPPKYASRRSFANRMLYNCFCSPEGPATILLWA